MILNKYFWKCKKVCTVKLTSILLSSALVFAHAFTHADGVVVDILGPQIEHKSYIKPIGREKLQSAILAKVSDDFGVLSVHLFYRLAGSQNFQSLAMRRNAASGAYFAPLKFSHQLPEEAVEIEYYFEAVDVNENKSIKMSNDGQLYKLDVAKSNKRKKEEKIKNDICRYNFTCDNQ